MSKYYSTGLLLLSMSAFAANNHNPASIKYVNQAIETAFQSAVHMTTYTAGTAITIQNNVISGDYTGSNGVSVAGSVISGAYTAAAGSGITITGSAIAQTPNYSIGDVVQGAVVFWLDDTNRHGLAVALVDQSVGGSPICDAGTTGATCPGPFVRSRGVGGGAINTAALLGAQLAAFATSSAPYRPESFAVSKANDYDASIGSGLFSGNFYLPTFDELLILYSNLTTVNAVLPGAGGAVIDPVTYWSSMGSLNKDGTVWAVHMGTGATTQYPQTDTYRVRAIRQF